LLGSQTHPFQDFVSGIHVTTEQSDIGSKFHQAARNLSTQDTSAAGDDDRLAREVITGCRFLDSH